jgi:hypothetical protein
VYYNCVKFHKNSISSLVGVALTRYMDGQVDSYIPPLPPPQTLFAGGIIILVYNFHITIHLEIITSIFFNPQKAHAPFFLKFP